MAGEARRQSLAAGSVEAARAAGKKAVRLDTFVTNAQAGAGSMNPAASTAWARTSIRYGNLGPTAVALYEKAL